jgi:D-beta-D-heptose 7-phosphate kinase/D-beta-D-heptose 1-phosphate adenosyltransferase
VPQKILKRDALARLADEAKRCGKRVVMTNGCFDLLHVGHLHLLREAKRRGDILIVALNNDRSVKAIKGPGRPILPESERSELIAALEMVDYVTLFDETDPKAVVEAIRPHVLVKGGDWEVNEIMGADIVKSEGGEVAVVPYLKGYSTTELIERIKAN